MTAQHTTAIDKSNYSSESKLFLKMLSKIDYGNIELTTPNGDVLNFKGEHEGPQVKLDIHDWQFCNDIYLSGDIGLGASYMAKKWDTDDISNLIEFVILNEAPLASVTKGAIHKILFYRLKHLLNFNSRRGSKKNIQAHYDLGNDFYTLWLDKSMTYSSALFQPDTKTLFEAQQNKYQRILDQLGASSGDRILEIGCGWGGFMAYAAKQGIHVKGITISREQLEYANLIMKQQNLDPLAKAIFEDYRDLDGTYDYIVSIEMFEALGESYWPKYMGKVSQLLTKKGRAVIQTITINNNDFASYRKSTDFIQQYIFPGGMLPSPNIFSERAKEAGMNIIQDYDFKQSYAKTLNEWEKQFRLKINDVKKLGYPETFIRMWEFYLKYCEGSFRAGKIGVCQFTLGKNI